MELETINKLFLELSQVSTARTKREINLAKGLATMLLYRGNDEFPELRGLVAETLIYERK